MNIPIFTIMISIIFLISLFIVYKVSFKFGVHRGYQDSLEMYKKENRFLRARQKLEDKKVQEIYPIETMSNNKFVVLKFPRSSVAFDILNDEIRDLVDMCKNKEVIKVNDVLYYISNVYVTDDEIRDIREASITVKPY